MRIHSNYWTCPQCLTKNHLSAYSCDFCSRRGYTSLVSCSSTGIRVPPFSEEVKKEEKQIINKKLLLLQ